MKLSLSVELSPGDADRFARAIDSMRALVDAFDGKMTLDSAGSPKQEPQPANIHPLPTAEFFEPILMGVAHSHIPVSAAAEFVRSTIQDDDKHLQYPQFEAAIIAVLVHPDRFERPNDRTLPDDDALSPTCLLLSMFSHLPEFYLATFRHNFLKICLLEFRKDRNPTDSRHAVYPYAETFAAFVLYDFVPLPAALKAIVSVMSEPRNQCAALTVLGKTVEICSNKIKLHADSTYLNHLRALIDSIHDDAFQYDIDYVRKAMGWSDPSQNRDSDSSPNSALEPDRLHGQEAKTEPEPQPDDF